jgi:hypothetical protein
MEDCLIPSPSVSWDDIVLWSCNLKGKGLHTTISSFVWLQLFTTFGV